MVQWSPLSRYVSVVAMAQALMAAPELMGFQCACFDLIAFKPPQLRAAVIHADRQASACIVLLAGFGLSAVFRGNAGALQKASEPQNTVGIEEGMVQSWRWVQHHCFTAAKLQLEAVF